MNIPYTSALATEITYQAHQYIKILAYIKSSGSHNANVDNDLKCMDSFSKLLLEITEFDYNVDVSGEDEATLIKILEIFKNIIISIEVDMMKVMALYVREDRVLEYTPISEKGKEYMKKYKALLDARDKKFKKDLVKID